MDFSEDFILIVTGWYGGELSYRHKVSIIEPRR